MPTVELTAEQYRRLEALTTELQSVHAGAYATVEDSDTITYLLDLADAVDDPDRTATPAGGDFPATAVRAELESRHRKSEDAELMDLYTIAAEYGITGRSSMTKEELVDAVLEQASSLYDDPFVDVDVPFPPTEPDMDTTPVAEEPDESTSETATDDAGPQLDAMLNLVETHSDKWTESEGDARYEVTLPDGSTETARTKDDVRALLFKHY